MIPSTRQCPSRTVVPDVSPWRGWGTPVAAGACPTLSSLVSCAPPPGFDGWWSTGVVSSGRRHLTALRLVARLSQERPAEPDLSDPAHELWALVRALPKRQAQVVALTFLQDRAVADIATLFGCGEETVRTHLRRGRQTLAARLRPKASSDMDPDDVPTNRDGVLDRRASSARTELRDGLDPEPPPFAQVGVRAVQRQVAGGAAAAILVVVAVVAGLLVTRSDPSSPLGYR